MTRSTPHHVKPYIFRQLTTPHTLCNPFGKGFRNPIMVPNPQVENHCTVACCAPSMPGAGRPYILRLHYPSFSPNFNTNCDSVLFFQRLAGNEKARSTSKIRASFPSGTCGTAGTVGSIYGMYVLDVEIGLKVSAKFRVRLY